MAQMTTPPPIKRLTAVIAAIVGMWFLASLGVFTVFRVGHWAIIPSADRALTVAQLGTFYLAFFGAQLPAIALVALVITHSTSRHPVLTAGVVTIICQAVMFGLRVVRWPWGSLSEIEWWMVVGLELIGIFALVFVAMAMSWVLKRANENS